MLALLALACGAQIAFDITTHLFCSILAMHSRAYVCIFIAIQFWCSCESLHVRVSFRILNVCGNVCCPPVSYWWPSCRRTTWSLEGHISHTLEERMNKILRKYYTETLISMYSRIWQCAHLIEHELHEQNCYLVKSWHHMLNQHVFLVYIFCIINW